MKKRILALLLAALMVIPFTAILTVSASAATVPEEPKETTTNKIYLSYGATGDGTSAATPCGSAGWGTEGAQGNMAGDVALNTGALWDIIKNGGRVIMTGKCYIGAEWAIYPTTNPLIFTGKDGDTSYVSEGEHQYFNADGQKGMMMLCNGKTITFMGDVIFENTVLLDRSKETPSVYRVGPNGRFVVKDTVVIAKSDDDIRPEIGIDNPVLNVMAGGVAFLHAAGFSDYTGDGTIVIEKNLYSQAAFSSFQGCVMDTQGNILQGTEVVVTPDTEKETEQATEKATEQTTEKTTEQTTEKATEKVTEKTTEKATEKSTEKATEKSTEKATEKSTEKAPASAEGGANVPLIIGIVAAVLVAAAVAVVIIVKKKKKA